MTYIYINMDELVMMEACYPQDISVSKIAVYLNRSRTSVYTVINSLKAGNFDFVYYFHYKENNSRCGRKKIVLL
jgi:IS30 family transposase